ncbi:hypothetical protein BM43_7537 (plasmid) [Burkholderia gladioli]|nr:hypothetical protein BM43_7537 [Burkholderia gladioli]
MDGPNASPSLAVGAVLLFKTLGVCHAPDALIQQCEDDAAHLNLLIEQLRAAAPTNG